MNYITLISTIESLCNNFSQQFTEGDVYAINWGQNSYPAINMSLVDVNQTKANSETYTITLFCIDLLNRDRSNKTTIQSDALETLKTIVNHFAESNTAILSLPVTYKVFTEKFTDECAGAFVTLRIEFLGECITED